jgi:hypothetical protein
MKVSRIKKELPYIKTQHPGINNKDNPRVKGMNKILIIIPKTPIKD